MSIKIELVGNYNDICEHLEALHEAFNGGAAGPVELAVEESPSTETSTGATSGAVLYDANAGPELDADKQPWSEALHSRNKTKKQDETWTVRRGVTKVQVAAAYAAAAPAAATAQTTEPVAQPAGPAAAFGQPTAAAQPALSLPDPAAAIQPAAPAPDPVAACLDVASKVMETAGGNAVATTAISDRINAIMSEHGLKGSDQLLESAKTNPQIAPSVLTHLQALARECGIEC